VDERGEGASSVKGGKMAKKNKITFYVGLDTQEWAVLNAEVERTFESRSHVIRRIIREWVQFKRLLGG
jgi:metal-responsive CopG/Arc/MetJ family transcriptional regulator